jgi:DNA primase small subunit
MLARTFEMLEPMFIEQVLPASGHGLLASAESCTALLDELPEAAVSVREHLLKKWSAKSFQSSSPEEKWDQLKAHVKGFLKASAKKGSAKTAKSMTSMERNRVENWVVEVVFRHGYPRLDINVSKMRNHLLKSPFSVHQKTGRVCVPILPSDVDSFDPFTVPTLPQLMDELDQYGREEESSSPASPTTRDVPDWKKTSLKDYFEPFQKKFLDPMTSGHRRQARDEAEEKAALTGEF